MSNPADEREFYDARWRSGDYANALKAARSAAILRELAELKLDAPRIVDLGCGTGWLTNILAAFGPTVGVELSPEAVARAREKYTLARFEQADFRSWDAPRGAFDVVVSQEVLEHVEDQSGYLAMAKRLLRPGGYLILTTPNKTTFNSLPAETRKAWTNQPIENWITADELHALATPYFSGVRTTSIILGYGTGTLRRFVNARRVRSRRVLASLARRAGYGLHLVMVASARPSA